MATNRPCTAMGESSTKLDPLGAVIRNMFNFSRFAPSEFYLVAQLVEDARCFSLSFSDLDNATRLINQLMNCTKE